MNVTSFLLYLAGMVYAMVLAAAIGPTPVNPDDAALAALWACLLLTPAIAMFGLGAYLDSKGGR